MFTPRIRRRIASTVGAVLLAGLVPLPAGSAAGAILAGRVVGTDGLTPQAGAVVSLFDAKSERIFASDPTRDDGGFRIADAPAGRYGVVVETPEGAYLLRNDVTLAEGANDPVALQLGSGGGPNFQSGPVVVGDDSVLPAWAKWTIIGFVSAAGVFVISEVTSDDNETLSSPP